MKKTKSLIIIIFLLSIVFLKTNSSNAEVSVGDVLKYKIIKSRAYAEVDENIVQGKGFGFLDNNFTENTNVDVTIDRIVELGVGMNYSVNGITRESFEPYYWIVNKNGVYLFTAVYHSYQASNIWSTVSGFHNGYYFVLYVLYKTTTEYWEFLENLEDFYTPLFETYNLLGYSLDYSFKYQDENDLVYFESWCGGKINGDYGFVLGFTEGVPTTLTFGCQFQIAIEKSTGIIKGMRHRGWAEGSINNKDVKLSMDYHYEIKFYNLPRFNSGTYSDFVPSFKFLLGIIAILPLFYLKKKKQANKR